MRLLSCRACVMCMSKLITSVKSCSSRENLLQCEVDSTMVSKFVRFFVCRAEFCRFKEGERSNDWKPTRKKESVVFSV